MTADAIGEATGAVIRFTGCRRSRRVPRAARPSRGRRAGGGRRRDGVRWRPRAHAPAFEGVDEETDADGFETAVQVALDGYVYGPSFVVYRYEGAAAARAARRVRQWRGTWQRMHSTTGVWRCIAWGGRVAVSALRFDAGA